MKNGKLVTAYLDYCEDLHNMQDDEARFERLIGDEGDTLCRACLADGWTMPELDAAYERRFGRKVNRPAH
jgi:hypothetical protein